MKRFTSFLALTLLLAATLHARAAERTWAVIDYMHIPVGKAESDYIAVEKLWQRIHQKAVDSGICRGWYLDRVENGGRNQFVTIRLYDSLSKVAEPWSDSLIKGLFNAEEQAVLNKTEEARQLTRSELWEIEASVFKKMGESTEGYNVVNFMKTAPGKDGAYYDLEKNLFQKFHKARVDAGDMNGWIFLSRSFPRGYDVEYDYITADLYPNKAASEKAWDLKLAESVLSKDEVAKAQKVEETRSIVRQEVWLPVLRVLPSSN